MTRLEAATQAAGVQVLEATLASGALIEQPAEMEPSGRKWRVRIFEYGLSKNRYPVGSGFFASEPRRFGFAHRPERKVEGPQGRGGSELLPPLAGAHGSDAESRFPLRWTERSARAALQHLDGARCFADHVHEGSASCHSVRDLVGYFSEPALGPRGPEATLTLLENESWARNKLLGAWRAGRLELIGFSIDAVVGVRPAGSGEQRVLEVDEIVSVQSVDMVCAASSGGQALEVLEAQEAEVRSRKSEVRAPCPSAALGTREDNEGAGNHSRGENMKQAIERMLEALPPAADTADGAGSDADVASRQLRQRLETLLAAGEIDPEQVLAALADWLMEVSDSGQSEPRALASDHPVDGAQCGRGWPLPDGRGSDAESGVPNPELTGVCEQVRSLRQQIADAVRRQHVAEHRVRLDGKLAASRLPKPLAALVASRLNSDGPFGGREFTEEAVEMEIQRVREAYAALSPVGKVMETGRVKVVREPEEKLQMALDRLFNLSVEDTSVPAFHGIREAYVAYTGDGEVTGLLPTQIRVREDITSTTFPNALGNTLRRLLLKQYREQDYGIGLLAQFSNVPDFRAQERVRVGYFGDLPTVSTESADYAELTAPTDEKASLSVVTFGGIVTITRKMVINDDLGVVPQIVARLGRSARRTLAQRVFNLMITNPAIYDSVAWFHATHGNLGSTALSAAELNAVRTAMRNRTEKDSNKKLGIAPHVLVVPHELEGLARQENMREYVDSSFTPNPVRFQFGANGERIIVSPLLTDATDWYVFANVEEAPTVEVGFLQGRQEPEFFLAEDPSTDKVFTSDKLRYKVRHEFEAAVIDFRGAYKEVVAG